MKNTLSLLLAVAALVVAGTTANAQSRPSMRKIFCLHNCEKQIAGNKVIKIKDASLGGMGCNVNEDASIQFSEDGETVVFSFGGFNRELPPFTGEGSPQATNNCQITLNLTLPAGIQVSDFVVKYDGFAMLPDQSSMDLFRTYQLMGIPGQKIIKKDTLFGETVEKLDNRGRSTGIFEAKQFPWDLSDKFAVSSALALRKICGKDVMLNINARMTLNNQNDMFGASASVDNITVTKQTRLYWGFAWGVCE